MEAKIKTEKSPAGTTRLAEALETPMATFLAAEALAKTVFPREVAEDAVRRLHGLSHQQAIHLAQDAAPYREDRHGASKMRDPLDTDE